MSDFAGGDGSSGSPYQIETWEHLDNVRDNLDDSFILNNDLDDETDGFSEYASSSANGGDGWEPIGLGGTPFSGEFDGDGYTISGFAVDRTSDSNVGLFSIMGGTVEHLGVTSAGVTGWEMQVGIIAGRNTGIIQECFADGTATVEHNINAQQAGALVGRNTGTIENSYARGDAVGDDIVGALVGANAGTIDRCYSTGDATGMTTGGIAGLNTEEITNTYYRTVHHTEGIGQDDGDTGDTTGLSTSDMQGSSAESNMSSLDFDSIWTTVDGDFPELQFDDDDDEERVSVSTHSATDVGEDSATLHGELTELENADDATVSFEYGESGAGFPESVEVDTLASPGSFEETVTGLDSDTEYEFKAVAESDEDSDEGSVETFTTDDVGPVSVSATGEEIDPGEVGTIAIDGTSVEAIRISAIWTDWGATDDVADGADFNDDPIESEGYCEFTWDSQQDSVSLELGVSPPESTYVGGEFKLTVTGEDADGETDETSAILEITA